MDDETVHRFGRDDDHLLIICFLSNAQFSVLKDTRFYAECNGAGLSC
jgi:hypothetical protein